MGENRYDPGILMVHSGQFWRCKHGFTRMAERECWRCLLRRPSVMLRKFFQWFQNPGEKP